MKAYDALVLAQAGLERLGLASVVTEVLDPAWMLPAVGQGALGLECRTDDAESRLLLANLDDSPTRQAVEAERSLLFHLGGGCQVPLGAIARVDAEDADFAGGCAGCRRLPTAGRRGDRPGRGRGRDWRAPRGAVARLRRRGAARGLAVTRSLCEADRVIPRDT